ncbi:cupin domain-containing protein [Domibacillus indicus]|jgi:quercetin dioxygenase-like cupin family protein|uniref:cupin domain-containing protein n=1 Tax=Domibacillus indicus TaxID=1437523 RepID=UPI00203B7C64|nr:cupin domain-containing protein [Domibacillus indicus]MCM3788622.1 cupin domain-containing protein [Domibacillus indicus]
MFVKGSETKTVHAGEGAVRKLLGCGGTLTMAEVEFEKGAIGEMHSHEHEQVCYIVQGRFQFNLNGDIRLLQKGDSVYVPSNIQHGVTALEDHSIILDVFTPQREDFY